jgi:alcohol dehydrogenase
LDGDLPDPAARAALVDTLEAWTSTLAMPGLATFGLDEAVIPAVVAGSRGSSMRTNPVVLEDAELSRVLRDAL